MDVEQTHESATSSLRTSDTKCTVKKILEKDFIVHEKTRGGTSTKKDKYYIDQKSGLEFFSQKDAEKYIKDGNTQRCMKQPRQRSEEEVHSLKAAAKMAGGSGDTADLGPDVETNPASQLEIEHDPAQDPNPKSDQPESDQVMHEPIVNADSKNETHPDVQPELSVQDFPMSVPVESEQFIIPYDVTSYPVWNNERELEDEAYWANWAENHKNTQSDSPSNLANWAEWADNLSEYNEAPADDDDETSSSKK